MPFIQGRKYEDAAPPETVVVAAFGVADVVGCGNVGCGCTGADVVDDEACSLTLRTSSGFPMMMPTAPEMYPAQKSADMML